MSDRSSAMLLFANRSIGTKIATGFAVVLLILAVSSVFAWLAFGSTAGALAEYARLVNRGAIYRDIDLQVAQYRGHVREYIFSNDEATATTVVKEGDTLRQIIASGLTNVAHPDRRRLMEDAAKQADLYAAHFQRLHAMSLERAKLETDVLDVVGPQMTDGFTSIMAGAAKTGNTDELPICFGVVRVAAAFPGGNFLDQGLLVGDAPIEALTRQNAEFGLCHIQPAAMLGRVVPLEPLDEPPRLGGGESFIK